MPKMRKIGNQVRAGYNSSGTQRCKCKECGIYYTIEPKWHAYPEAAKALAIKLYDSGVSGRGVGNVLGMNKSNVVNWIKKSVRSREGEKLSTARADTVELDELYWFLEQKPRTKTRENLYIMTMVSRSPRKILGHAVSRDKTSGTIQRMVDAAPEAKRYCTDEYYGYLDVVFPGTHRFNIHNKNDTFTVEGVNADLRHYISTLARRSRYFPRKLEDLQAVLAVFVRTYNRFGAAKLRFRSSYPAAYPPFSLLDFLVTAHMDTPFHQTTLRRTSKYDKIEKRW